MALIDKKITTPIRYHQDNANTVIGQASTMKALFDQGAEDLRVKLNGVIDELLATTGAQQIGIDPARGLGNTLADALTSIKDYMNLGASSISANVIGSGSGNTVQSQLEWLLLQIQNVLLNQIPDGTITMQKLATALANTINDNTSNIGDLTALTTTEKANLVRAINENTTQLAQLTNPNLLINGDFQIWQRGTSFTNITTDFYSADRWMIRGPAGSSHSIIRESSALRPELNIIRVTRNNNVLGNLAQNIENLRQFSNKTVTLSFWARSNGSSFRTGMAVAGNYGLGTEEIYHYSEIDVTQTFTKYEITIQIPDLRNKTFNNGHYLVLYLFRDNVAGRTIDISNVKLEFGSVATPFCPKGYAEELVSCQRYYETFYHSERLTANPSAITAYEFCFPYKVTKRIEPVQSITSLQIGGATQTPSSYITMGVSNVNSFFGYTVSNLAIGTRFTFSGVADAEIY